MSNSDDKKIKQNSACEQYEERRNTFSDSRKPLLENYTISQANQPVKKPNIIKKNENND